MLRSPSPVFRRPSPVAPKRSFSERISDAFQFHFIMPSAPTFPVLAGHDRTRPRCVVCGRPCGEPGSFLVLEAGAVLHTDATRRNGGPDDLMSAYLTLVKHGKEPDGPYTRLDIVDELIGGQADMLFCSGPCLRRFFSLAVDELERRWESDRKRNIEPAE